MPRIKDLRRWLSRRIRKPGDFTYFKIISKNWYKSKLWWYAIVSIVYSTRDSIVLVMYTQKPVEWTFEYDCEVLVKEFASVSDAVNFVETWFKRDKYVYYYPRIRTLLYTLPPWRACSTKTPEPDEITEESKKWRSSREEKCIRDIT